jgi:hypothetical protein
MQRLLLFLSTLFLTASTVSAATLSGTITSVATCAPVSGQKVYAEDSLRSWRDSAVTNGAGYYSMTIPSTVYAGTAGQIFVTAQACGTTVYSQVSYRPGNNIYVNLVVCGSISAIGGVVTLGANVGYPEAAKVWLIREDINPSTFDTTLTAVDSAFVTSGPNSWDSPWFQFTMACPNTSDVYLLKAALLPSDPNYASYLPSYFDSGLTWNSRTPFIGQDFITPPSRSLFIYLKPGTNPGGPGFVGGNVMLGANKTSAVGDPLSRRILILTTAAGKAIGCTYSDAAGKFKFNNVPVGNYKIFGDAGGKWNPELSFSITGAKPTVNNIIFEENDSKFEGHLSTTSVASQNALPGVTIFPNPATDYVRVEGLSAIKGIKTIVLGSITGQEISRQILEGNGRVDIASLPRGMYTLSIQTEAGNATYSILK